MFENKNKITSLFGSQKAECEQYFGGIFSQLKVRKSH